MHSSNTLRFLFVLAVTSMSCSTQVVAPTGGGAGSSSGSTSESVSSSSGPLPQAGTYVLDFTGCRLGGLELGGATGVSFTVDLQEPVRTYAIQDPYPQIGPGVIGKDDSYQGCPVYPANFQGGGKLTDHLAAVGPGDLANVSNVTLDILSQHPTNLSETYCYIYRNGAGTWAADSSKASRTWDASANVFVPVHRAAGKSEGGRVLSRAA